MKNTKRRTEIISFYDRTGLEKHFTKMAKKGWMIENISNLCWTYRKIEPSDIHFCVTYYAGASDFDPGPSDKQQTFYEFCSRTGWNLCCTWHQMQVFYNEAEDPIPLETDPLLEVYGIHKAAKKSFLSGHFILLAIALLYCGYFVFNLLSDPITALSTAGTFMSACAYLFIFVLVGTELFTYYIWYAKAKRAAQIGRFTDTPSTKTFQLTLLSVFLILYVTHLGRLIYNGGHIYLWITLWAFVLMIGMYFIVHAIKNKLQASLAPKGLTITLTVIIFIVLYIGIIAVGAVVFSSSIKSGILQPDQRRNEIPLSVTDLTDAPMEHYLQHNQYNETVLASHREVQQYPRYEYEKHPNHPRLFYSITKSDIPPLFRWFKKFYLDGNAAGQTSPYNLKYTPTDPLPWGALEAYKQLDDTGRSKNSFLLIYENTIILIHFDDEPTETEIAFVAGKLTP